jgi:hypothetical protein
MNKEKLIIVLLLLIVFPAFSQNLNDTFGDCSIWTKKKKVYDVANDIVYWSEAYTYCSYGINLYGESTPDGLIIQSTDLFRAYSFKSGTKYIVKVNLNTSYFGNYIIPTKWIQFKVYAANGFNNGFIDLKLIGASAYSSQINATEIFIFTADKNYSTLVVEATNLNSDPYVLSEPNFIAINSLLVLENPCQGTGATISGATIMCQNQITPLTSSLGLSYLWSTGQTTRSISPTAAGTYTVTVVDNSNCLQTGSVSVQFLPTPPSPTISRSGAPNGTCALGGDVTLTSSAGSAYQWYSAFSGFPPTDIAGATGQTYTVLNDNATFGINYYVGVKTYSSNGCYSNAGSVYVFFPPLPSGNIQITFSELSSLCTTGTTLRAFSSGSSNNTYKWSTNETTQSIKAYSPGTYSVTVTNQYGCASVYSESIGNTTTLTPTTAITSSEFLVDKCVDVVILPTTTISPVTIIKPTCANAGISLGGSSTLTATPTQSGVTYQWYDNGQPIANATGSSYNATQAGYYSVKATNSQGCSYMGQGVSVMGCNGPYSSIVGPSAICDGEATFVTTSLSGMPYSNALAYPPNPYPYTYLWSTGQTDPGIEIFHPGTYTVTVTDSYTKCQATAVITIALRASCGGGGGQQLSRISSNEIEDDLNVYPNPSNSEINDNLNVHPNPSDKELTVLLRQPVTNEALIYIYDLSGRQIFKNDVSSGMKQITISTKDIPSGAYLLRVTGADKIYQKKIIIVHR